MVTIVSQRNIVKTSGGAKFVKVMITNVTKLRMIIISHMINYNFVFKYYFCMNFLTEIEK